MVAEFMQGKPYTCQALMPSKGKEVAKLDREAYLFDISMVDHIFDSLVKDKHIKLPKGHKITPADEIKGKKYCKWHHSWTHTTNNYIIFRNSIQKALKEEKLKLAEKGDMAIDTNPFGMSMNMVSISISKRKEIKSLDGRGN